jgi:hypothetical protein
LRNLLLVLNQFFLAFNAVMFVISLVTGGIAMGLFYLMCGAINYVAITQLS